MIELVVPAAPPSLNLLLRMHWSQGRKLKASWNRWVWVLVHQQGGVRQPMFRARVDIERQSPKLLDKDNAYGACKCVVDALVNNGVIEDDSPQHIDLHVTQVRGPAQTRITVREIRQITETQRPQTAVAS